MGLLPIRDQAITAPSRQTLEGIRIVGGLARLHLILVEVNIRLGT